MSGYVHTSMVRPWCVHGCVHPVSVKNQWCVHTSKVQSVFFRARGRAREDINFLCGRVDTLDVGLPK